MMYFYAKFDENGRCSQVTSSPINLEVDHLIDRNSDPESIFLDVDGVIKDRQDVHIDTDRDLFFSDGSDLPVLIGAPSDATLLINGDVGHISPSHFPQEVIIQTVGKYRSNVIRIKFDTRQSIENILMKRIDDAAGAARKSYITDIPGQSSIYTQKRQEAERFLAHGDDGGPYVFIKDVEQANGVMAQASACDTALSSIESARLGAKHGVRSAETVAEMIEVSEVDWSKVV